MRTDGDTDTRVIAVMAEDEQLPMVEGVLAALRLGHSQQGAVFRGKSYHAVIGKSGVNVNGTCMMGRKMSQSFFLRPTWDKKIRTLLSL